MNRGIPQPHRGEDMPRKSLDALGVTQRFGLVVGGAFPPTACHVANGQTPLRGVRQWGGLSKAVGRCNLRSRSRTLLAKCSESTCITSAALLPSELIF